MLASHACQGPDRLLAMFRPPLLCLDVRIVPKLHPALLPVCPLVRIPATGIHAIRIRLRSSFRTLTRRDRNWNRRSVAQPPPEILALLAQHRLHRAPHLPISLLLFRAVWHVEDVLVQSGRGLRGRGACIANRFVRT